MRMPNSIARGAPKLNTPVPAPTRLVMRSAAVVPLIEPALPFKAPVRALGGRSKLAEVEQIEETKARLQLNDVALRLNLVSPAQPQVKRAQTAHVLLAGRG